MSAATEIVHWPGKETAMCERHGEIARRLARAMGFEVSATPIVGVGTDHVVLECKNCENEEKKREG